MYEDLGHAEVVSLELDGERAAAEFREFAKVYFRQFRKTPFGMLRLDPQGAKLHPPLLNDLYACKRVLHSNSV